MKIILTGLPGSGKTFLGNQLAALLQIPFFDLDRIIEEKSGKKVAELFAGSGEDFFRRLEHDSLLQLLELQGDYVLATGGGTPCFFDNMPKINQHGLSVFLNPPADVICRRLSAMEETGKRPLLQTSESLPALIDQLKLERMPYYRQARLMYAGENFQELAMLIREMV